MLAVLVLAPLAGFAVELCGGEPCDTLRLPVSGEGGDLAPLDVMGTPVNVGLESGADVHHEFDSGADLPLLDPLTPQPEPLGLPEEPRK